MKAQVYNLKGDVVGDIELSDKIFAREWNPDLVHQIALSQAANRRSPWAHSKNRAEVRGGGVKPWKQKHTGRARHGGTVLFQKSKQKNVARRAPLRAFQKAGGRSVARGGISRNRSPKNQSHVRRD